MAPKSPGANGVLQRCFFLKGATGINRSGLDQLTRQTP